MAAENDFAAKLDKLMSDSRAMEQIKALASEMQQKSEAEATPRSTETESRQPQEVSPASAQSLLKELLGGSASSPPTDASSEKKGSSLKEKTALLSALRPYLDAAGKEKVDKMLKFLHLAEMAGSFKNLI